MNVVSGKYKEEDLIKYKDITKVYPILKFEQQATKKMKLRYNNPYDEDKIIIVESTDEDILYVRTKEIKIEQKASEFIRLIFNMPRTIGVYTPKVVVTNKANGEIEEILMFQCQVI